MIDSSKMKPSKAACGYHIILTGTVVNSNQVTLYFEHAYHTLKFGPVQVVCNFVYYLVEEEKDTQNNNIVNGSFSNELIKFSGHMQCKI